MPQLKGYALMNTDSPLTLATRLEETGLPTNQARAIISSMEEMLGTPLTKEVFEAELRAALTAHNAGMETRLTKLEGGLSLLTSEVRHLASEMAAFRDAIQAGQESFKREAELKEEAFEHRIKASIFKGRLATYGGLMLLIAGVLTLLARSFGLNLPLQ